MVAEGEFLISSANNIPGYKIIDTKGFAYGLTVRSRGIGGQLGAGVRSVFGGEIKEYVRMMEDARNEAINRLIHHARYLGANALIAVRYDSESISEIMQEVLAYGTAVVVERDK